MNSAQTFFIVTAWFFLLIAGLLFLLPPQFGSSKAAAWVALSVGMVSHVALLVALVIDGTTSEDNPPSEG